MTGVQTCALPIYKVKLVYNMDNKRYIAFDDGAGNITGDFIATGTIDYVTHELVLIFTQAVTDDEEVEISYGFNRIYTPDALSTIDVDFYFTNASVEITEAGLYTESGDLLAYATFPPVEFINGRNHLNFGFAILKDTFTSQII